MRRLLIIVLLLIAASAWGQAQRFNANVVITGTLNAATAGGSSNAYTLTLPATITQYVTNQCFMFKANHTNSGAATVNIQSLGAKAIKKFVGGTVADVAANDIGNGQPVMICYDGTNMVLMSSAPSGTGTGDFSSNTGTSVDGEVVLFSGTGGKTGKRATGSGLATLTSGVLGALTSSTVGQVCRVGAGPTIGFGALDLSDSDAITGDLPLSNLAPAGGADVLLGRGDSGSGDWQQISLGTGLDMVGTTLNVTVAGGDITQVGACVSGTCATDAFPLTGFTMGTAAAPGTPAAGAARLWLDSTSKNVVSKNDTGAVVHMVQTKAAETNKVLTAISDDGTVTNAQLASTALSDTANLVRNTGALKVFDKQIVPRVTELTPSGNAITPNVDTHDFVFVQNIAAGLTINNPTATGSNPEDGQELTIMFESDAVRSLTWGTAYNADSNIALPTATRGVSNVYEWVKFVFNPIAQEWSLVATSMGLERGVTTLASSTTFTCPADTSKLCEMQMTAGSGTLTVAAPTGSVVNGDKLQLSFLCTNSQTFSWNSTFIASPAIALPTTCPAGTTQWAMTGFQWSTVLAKWQLIAKNFE